MRDLDLFKWLNIAITSGIICAGNCAMSTTGCAYAQITPDSTLPINSNIQKIDNTIKIEGGTTAGSNLFHSFSEFSLTTGSTADFDNSLNIQNIISRVTGKSLSNIDGLIRANGTANLFLINPNGIIFGQNAQLDIGGSFIASTASSLKFPDGFEFSAKNPQSTSLLSINVPIGLQYGANPGTIQVKGNGQGVRLTDELIDTPNALRVPANETLALVGGDIFLEGATLKTAGGRIELGSVGDNSLVSLTPITKGFSLSYDGVQNFGNIQLSQLSAVDASGVGSGDIQVQGRRVTLSDGSEIEASTLGAGKGGKLVVNATESVELVGISADAQSPSGFFSATYPGKTGDAGNLTINTQDLLVQDGAHVTVSTFGAGKGGSLTVNANNVQIIGTSADGEFPSGLFARTKTIGNAGNLTINTQHLLMQNGAQVSASTFGAGKGGSLTVNANNMQLISTSADGRFSSSLFADARSTGDAGNLTINTQHLLVRDGARVGDGTFGAGKGGSLTVTANDVQLIGTSAKSQASSGLYTQAELISTGNAGNLTINTDKLLVQDGAVVNVRSQGQGIAGNLTINAGSILLNNNAALNANTQAVNTDPNIEQATINLRSKDLILLRGSNIVTNAKGENVIGGNINIDTDILVAFADSDISANSSDFRGGNVKIKATGIFGTQLRDTPTLDSDITATGVNQQLNGTVQINTPDIDPSSGLVELPVDFVDRSDLIAQGCPANKGNSFTITGRGGLPPLPTQALRTNQTATVDWVTLNPQEQRSTSVGKNSHFRKSFGHKSPDLEVPQISPTILEATGWVINKSGTVELTAFTPIATHTNTFTPAIALGGTCPSQATTIQK